MCCIRYTGKLDDGTVFDSTKGKKPLKFRLGMIEVIKGMEVAVATMAVGERAIVHIPPNYGYGDRGQGIIIPNSELTFEIELVEAYDDTFSKLKWQVLGFVIFTLFMVVLVPRLQPEYHHRK